MTSSKILKSKLLTILLSSLIFCLLLPSCSKAQKKKSDVEQIQITKSDPWKESDIIMPGTLNAELKNNNNKPMLIQMGFKMLYDQSHIPGSVYAGPAFKDNGIDAFKEDTAER